MEEYKKADLLHLPEYVSCDCHSFLYIMNIIAERLWNVGLDYTSGNSHLATNLTVFECPPDSGWWYSQNSGWYPDPTLEWVSRDGEIF